MGQEKIIPILALIILIVSGTSSAYVYISQVDKETIALNGEEYTIDQLNFIGETKTVQTVEGEITGISLEDLILKVGIACPSCYIYTIIGKDGYQQTVDWEIMKTGVLTNIKKVYFPDTAKKFWVGDIVEIEVK